MTYQKKSNFRSIGKLIEPLVRRHGSTSIVSHSKLFNIWGTLVGEDISKKAQPIKIKSIFIIGFRVEMFGLNLSKLDFEKNNF